MSSSNPSSPVPSGSDESSLLRTAGVTERGITQAVTGAHESAAARVLELQEKQRGFFTKFFAERGLTKVLQDSKIQEVKDYTEYQRRIFALATETKLEMCHSICLSMTRELKVENSKRFNIMVTEAYETLSRNVKAKQATFLADTDDAATNAERYAHRPWLMEDALESIQKETRGFFTWLDSLLEDFRKISDERLAEYRKAESQAPRPASGGSGTWST